MCDVGHQVDVVNIKFALALPFGINLSEKLNLIFIEILSHLFHHPNVAEKLSTQVAVAHDGLANHAQMRID